MILITLYNVFAFADCLRYDKRKICEVKNMAETELTYEDIEAKGIDISMVKSCKNSDSWLNLTG